jgi:hypothetical protein
VQMTDGLLEPSLVNCDLVANEVPSSMARSFQCRLGYVGSLGAHRMNGWLSSAVFDNSPRFSSGWTAERMNSAKESIRRESRNEQHRSHRETCSATSDHSAGPR